MHRSIFDWLTRTLALALLFSAATAAKAQYNNPAASGEGNYTVTADSAVTIPFTQASSAENYTLSTVVADDGDLAKRLADVEKALKKIDDKAAADKKAAALAPSVKFSGRAQWDTDTFSQNATSRATIGDALSGSEFRRLYVGAAGAMFDVFDYKVEVDLVPSHVSWKDVYVQIHDLPLVQNVRAGHFYTPFGLETETSDLNTVFVERGIIDSLGGIGSRHAGIMAFGNALDERSWWGIGAFATQKNENPPTFPVTGFEDDAGTAIYGRVTCLPWYDEATNGRGLWHVGMSAESGAIPSVRTVVPPATPPTRFSISAKPEANLAPTVVNTGNIADANYVNALNFETAFVYGPLSVQAEYEWISVRRTANPDPTFDGGYIFVSYFLTGENRVYNKKTATFGRIVPFGNFFRVRTEDGYIETGKGAWEVGYRCSYLNLDDAGIRGNRVVDNTVGLNWYMTSYLKLMFDLVHSDARNNNTLNAFLTRVQFDF